MTTQPEALRLADALDDPRMVVFFDQRSKAAAELRRLVAENEQLAALVCDYAAEEAPDALRTVAADRDRWHAKAQQAEAQRDALLEALKLARSIIGHPADAHSQMIDAAIKMAEEGK